METSNKLPAAFTPHPPPNRKAGGSPWPCGAWAPFPAPSPMLQDSLLERRAPGEYELTSKNN